jgi:hypothetical protein
VSKDDFTKEKRVRKGIHLSVVFEYLQLNRKEQNAKILGHQRNHKEGYTGAEC